MSKYFKEFKKAVIKDLEGTERYNTYDRAFLRGFVCGSYKLMNLTEKERDKILQLINKHYKENYNWLGKLIPKEKRKK